MAQQESNSNSETRPALKKTFLQSTIALLRSLVVFSKTLLFIGGLVVSYKYVEIAVLSTLMGYLTDGKNDDLRIAAAVINLLDGLSYILFAFVSLMSEAYTDCFTMIAICAAASIEGLMLLWTSASTSFGWVYAAIFLLALGESGQNLSESFYEYQLQERIKEKKQQYEAGVIGWNIWLLAPSIIGYILTLYIDFTVNNDETYEDRFRFGALLLGGTYLFFLFGSVWYKCQKLNSESNLCKIYRICKTAFRNRKSKYPTSLDCYYWKGYKQGHGYEFGKGQRLLPRVPCLFRWLDKAAIFNVEDSSDPETITMTQNKNGQLCTVKEVREVKSVVPMIYLGLFIFPYSLLTASGNTFFAAQASSMEQNITSNGNDISILFLIMDCMTNVSIFICFIISFGFRRLRKFKAINDRSRRKAGTIIRIGFGMVCSVICSLIAWKVEVHRLSLPYIFDKEGDIKRGTTSALVPQFIMLGMTEGLVGGGLVNLFHGHVAKSMWSFDQSFSALVIGSGKLLIIPLVFIFRIWFKESVDTSHLNWFYMMLAILNAAFFLFFAYYSIRYAYKEECPEDEQVTNQSDSENHSNQENNEAHLQNQGPHPPEELPDDENIAAESTPEPVDIQDSQHCDDPANNDETQEGITH